MENRGIEESRRTVEKYKRVSLDSFHERFSHLINLSGMTQIDVGAKLGIRQTHVSGLSKGRNKPSSELMKRIAELFDVPENWLAYGDEQEAPSSPQSQELELILSEIRRVYEGTTTDSEKFALQGEMYAFLKGFQENLKSK